MVNIGRTGSWWSHKDHSDAIGSVDLGLRIASLDVKSVLEVLNASLELLNQLVQILRNWCHCEGEEVNAKMLGSWVIDGDNIQHSEVVDESRNDGKGV